MGATYSGVRAMMESTKISPLFRKGAECLMKDLPKQALKHFNEAARIERTTRKHKHAIYELDLLRTVACLNLKNYDEALKITEKHLKERRYSPRLLFFRYFAQKGKKNSK